MLIVQYLPHIFLPGILIFLSLSRAIMPNLKSAYIISDANSLLAVVQEITLPSMPPSAEKYALSKLESCILDNCGQKWGKCLFFELSPHKSEIISLQKLDEI